MLKLPHDCLRRYLKKMTNYKVEPTTEAILNVATWYHDFHALVSSHISLSKNALYFPWLKNIEVPKSETLVEVNLLLSELYVPDEYTLNHHASIPIYRIMPY